MTLLGKIFTALIFVASLVTLTLAVMVGASHKSWKIQAIENKGKYEDLKVARDGAVQQREVLEKDIERERIARALALQQLQIKAEQRQAEVEQKEAQLAAETQKSQESLARLRDALARLQELEGQLKDLRSENIVLRTDLHEETTQVVTLTDANHQLDAKVMNMEERYGQLSNEIAMMEKVMTANGLDINSLTAHIPPAIDGRISKISPNIRGLVEINLGSDDGIRKGHEFDIYRGVNYLGRMKITETSPNHAVGQLIDELTRGPIKEDDRVTTKLRG